MNFRFRLNDICSIKLFSKTLRRAQLFKNIFTYLLLAVALRTTHGTGWYIHTYIYMYIYIYI